MLTRPRVRKLGGGLTLRLLSAWETLQARQEAHNMEGDDVARALRSNACVVARSLEKGGKALFEDGDEVMKRLTASQIGELARLWAEFDREENPAPTDSEERVQALKKALGTRLMSVFNGVCSRSSGRCPPRRGRGR